MSSPHDAPGAAPATVRTVEDGRLLWWREEADDDYWWRSFEKQIESSQAAARAGQMGRLGEVLRAALPRRGRILEAGCGTGWMVAGLRAEGFEVEGVEHSPRLVAAVGERYPDLPIRQGNVTALDLPAGHYQGYISLGVIEHFRDGCAPFLEEAERLVAPGGVLCISVPHFNALRRLKARLGAFRGDPGELPFYQYAFTRRDFARLLEPYAFEILGFEGYAAMRCLQVELPRAYAGMLRTPVLWRLPRLAGALDRTGLVSHMILAVLRRA